jgi:hypothetical protein
LKSRASTRIDFSNNAAAKDQTQNDSQLEEIPDEDDEVYSKLLPGK